MDLPQGVYTGTVHGWFKPVNLFWRGKVFTGTTVTNRILGGLWVEGQASIVGATVWITYPRLGLTDVLIQRHVGDSSVWDGSMVLGWLVVPFTLTKEGA